MPGTRILYISGSLGLGHIKRDLAIARELRLRVPDADISWIAYHPSTILLEAAGERLHPEADLFVNDNDAAERSARGYDLNLFAYMVNVRSDWERNVRAFMKIARGEQFDLVIGDETYELMMFLGKHPGQAPAPFVMIYDFCGMDAMSRNPLEHLIFYKINRDWSRDGDFLSLPGNLGIFIGELEDVPDRPFGFLLPKRREHVRKTYRVVGHILSFDPARYVDTAAVKARLGYGPGPLVVCSIGGTSVGKPLLNLCLQAFPLMRERFPDLKLLAVCGPRLSAEGLEVPAGADVLVRGYVPDLHEHLAACDLAISMGGGTTTLELTALRKPFLYFPVKGHCEQELGVAGRLERISAGVRMDFAGTTPRSLAETVADQIGRKVNYPALNADGARKAADSIARLL